MTEYRFTQKVKDEWIAALESGNYQQAMGRLRKPVPEGEKPSMCCLGVLCDVLGLEWQLRGSEWYVLVGDERWWSMPPHIEGLLDDSRDFVAKNDGVRSYQFYASLNDDKMLSFHQIANAVRDCPVVPDEEDE